jgi:hypothetical protein
LFHTSRQRAGARQPLPEQITGVPPSVTPRV